MFIVTETTTVEQEEPVQKNKGGRRSKAQINAIRAKVGLPPKKEARGRPRKISIVSNTDKARQQELLAGLLHSKGRHIIEQIINKALDPSDKDQMACMKLCVDRVLPMSYFEKSKESSNKGVTIQIMGVGAEPVVINAVSTPIEPELLEYEDAAED